MTRQDSDAAQEERPSIFIPKPRRSSLANLCHIQMIWVMTEFRARKEPYGSAALSAIRSFLPQYFVSS